MATIREVAVVGYSTDGYNGQKVPVDPTHPMPVAIVGAGGAASTPTRTTVNSGTSSVTILAANTAREGAIICNTDANELLLDLSGGTASASRFQYALANKQTLEVPFGFTGLITGIWTGDGSGIADVVEFS